MLEWVLLEAIPAHLQRPGRRKPGDDAWSCPPGKPVPREGPSVTPESHPQLLGTGLGQASRWMLHSSYLLPSSWPPGEVGVPGLHTAPEPAERSRNLPEVTQPQAPGLALLPVLSRTPERPHQDFPGSLWDCSWGVTGSLSGQGLGPHRQGGARPAPHTLLSPPGQ